MLVLVAVDEAVEEVGGCGQAGEGGLEGGQVWRLFGGWFCVVAGHEKAYLGFVESRGNLKDRVSRIIVIRDTSLALNFWVSEGWTLITLVHPGLDYHVGLAALVSWEEMAQGRVPPSIMRLLVGTGLGRFGQNPGLRGRGPAGN